MPTTKAAKKKPTTKLKRRRRYVSCLLRKEEGTLTTTFQVIKGVTFDELAARVNDLRATVHDDETGSLYIEPAGGPLVKGAEIGMAFWVYTWTPEPAPAEQPEGIEE